MPTQSEERQRYLDLILESDSVKQLIVAGPGTGKTYTFKQLLKSLGPGNYLVLSFIRKLVDDIAFEMGDMAEVKTFHAFCKRILHEQQGKVDIYPKLPEIIQDDATLLNYDYSDFETKFRNLEEATPDIAFFLARGDYYKYLSFDDSVYRLYQLLKEDNSILGEYDHIIVDEYQDFNLLEVEFLKELEKTGPILIAGDDDQAIYEGRSSSPDYLRERYKSGDYDIFELPYCSRCPEVVVNATNSFIENLIAYGGLKNRLKKSYFPYTDGNEETNRLHPKIKVIEVPVISTIAKYIDKEIQKIPSGEILESNNTDSSYPTVLIIGQRHYLSELHKKLVRTYPQIEFDAKSQEDQSRILDGIKMLIRDENSNLGWRVLAEELLSRIVLKSVIIESRNLSPLRGLLEEDFLQPIVGLINLIKLVKQESREFSNDEKRTIKEKFPSDADIIINYFSPGEEEEQAEQDPEEPTILLRTFEGSKGLSGGHVFIVGANDGSIPKFEKEDEVKDIECCKFVVALTRTRKQCHIISNRWLNSPKNSDGSWTDKFKKSTFLGMIPRECVEDSGYKRSEQIE
ncbi:MAG: ATP-dependent helicase [Bacteroidales bacterium]